MRPFLSAILLIAFSTTSSAQTERSERSRDGFVLSFRGQSVGVGIQNPNSPFSEDVGAEGGLGGELSVAYGFSRRIAGFAALGVAGVAGDDVGVLGGLSYRLGMADVGARANILPEARINPYAALALTALSAAGNEGGDATGGGVTVSLGADWAMTRSLLLDLGFGLTAGRFTSIDRVSPGGEILGAGESSDVAVARLGLGLRYIPQPISAGSGRSRTR